MPSNTPTTTTTETDASITLADGYSPTTYDATLMAPLFYASHEGRVIETQPTIAATALCHALGYTLPDIDLAKRYVEFDDAANTPTYEHLAELDLFVSDMTPVSVDVDEHTFRSTAYTTEHRVTAQDSTVAEQLPNSNNQTYPAILGTSMAGWHRQRNYTGVTPGSEYRFTVWTPETVSLPDSLRFEMGISRTGEFRCNKTELSSTVSLNEFLLSNVYDTTVDPATILSHADNFERGNDPRLIHYTGVDRQWVDETLF